MAVICTVRIPLPVEDVRRFEADNPDITAAIIAAGSKYITSHRVAAGDGETLELNEYADREAYDAFIAEAGPAIRKLNEIMGAKAVDTVYTLIDLTEGG